MAGMVDVVTGVVTVLTGVVTVVILSVVAVSSFLFSLFLAFVDFIFKCYLFTYFFVCDLFNGFVSSGYI